MDKSGCTMPLSSLLTPMFMSNFPHGLSSSLLSQLSQSQFLSSPMGSELRGHSNVKCSLAPSPPPPHPPPPPQPTCSVSPLNAPLPPPTASTVPRHPVDKEQCKRDYRKRSGASSSSSRLMSELMSQPDCQDLARMHNLFNSACCYTSHLFANAPPPPPQTNGVSTVA